MTTFLDKLLNRTPKSTIIAWAKDAKPEEVAELVGQLGDEVEKHQQAPQVVTKVSVAKDVVADDNAADRKRMHDALDRRLDGKDAEEEETKAADKDLAHLFKGKDEVPRGKSLASLFAVDAAEDEEEEEEEKEKKGEDEEEEAEDEAGALTIEPGDRPQSAGPGTIDEIVAARREGATAVLRELKPHVARIGDKRLKAAFDSTAQTVQGKSHGKTSDGYSKVAKASVQRSRAAMDSVDEAQASKKRMESYSALEKLYADRWVGTKR